VSYRALSDRCATDLCQWRFVVATLVLSYRQAERENLLQDKSLMM
jgi:hypothetical protein